jgi:hypothetical protein
VYNFSLKYTWTNNNSKCNFYRIILEQEEMRYEDLHWICFVQDRDQWQVLVTSLIKYRVKQKAGEYLDQLRKY